MWGWGLRFKNNNEKSSSAKPLIKGRRSQWVREFWVLLMLLIPLLIWNNCSPLKSRLSTSLSAVEAGGGNSGEVDGRDKFSLMSCAPDSSVAASDTRRLTKNEIINTIGDLFGSDVAAEVAPTLSRLPEDLLSNDVNQFDNTLTEQHLDVLADLAMAVGQAIKSALDPNNIMCPGKLGLGKTKG